MQAQTTQIGIVSPVVKGEWDSTVTYNKLNIVTHNGVSFIAYGTVTGIVEPGVTAGWESYWMKLSTSPVPMGEWNSTTTYPYLAIVTLDGSSYIANEENYNKNPATSSSWQLIAEKGDDGGFSPTAKVEQTADGAVITITDKSGTTTATVTDGKDGENGTNGTDGKNGTDGVSPTVATQAITGGTKVTITDKDGAHAFNVMNGTNGTNGKDGTNGADGTDGITPTIGANGNWYLGNTDTGKPSRGATGATGATGAAGKSAYASAQDGGFTGTEAQFNKGLSVMGQVDGVEDTDALGIDTTVTQNSGNLITSGAVYSYVQSLDGGNEVPTIVCNPTLYATVGHEFVLYYNNILRCMRPENFIVTTVLPSGSTLSSLEPEFERCLKFTPTSTNIGTHAVTIKVIDKSTWLTVAEKAINIIISADSTRRNRKVMFIGDSLTYASTYGAEIANMSNDGIVSIGTIDHAITFNGATVHVKTEGRNGYASYDYVALQTAHSTTNPFYNPNTEYSLTLDKKYTSATGILTFDNSGTVSILKHHFDFAYYMTNNGATVGTPDAVFINLGTNGGNGYALSDVYVAFDAMIDRIHAYNADLPIFLHLFPPTSGAGNTSRAAAVRNTRPELDSRVGYYDCIQILIDRYKNDDRITIVPVNTILDRLYDYKLETVPVSARNPIEVTIGQSDAVHPAKPGYLHMADAYYNVLQHLWDTDDPTPTPTYTNLNAGAGTVITNGVASLDKCVYQAGTYISTASAYTLNTDANATTFGMIAAADGDTIYTKGISIPIGIAQPTTTQTHARLGFANHDASTNKTSWIAEHKFYNSSSDYLTITALDEAAKYYKIQISASTGLTYNYIGISFDTTNGGADTLIITKNEPIQ